MPLLVRSGDADVDSALCDTRDVILVVLLFLSVEEPWFLPLPWAFLSHFVWSLPCVWLAVGSLSAK